MSSAMRGKREGGKSDHAIRRFLRMTILRLATLSLLGRLLGVEPLTSPLLPSVAAFAGQSFDSRSRSRFDSKIYNSKPVLVVGKIIVDEYGDPYPDSDGREKKASSSSAAPSPSPSPPKTVSIGGGGPQAAFGAAAALAVWVRHYRETGDKHAAVSTSDKSPTVVFVAPVGKDWEDSDTVALKSSLGAFSSVVVHSGNVTVSTFGDNDPPDFPTIQTHLIQSGCIHTDKEDNGFFTPRIRLWHDQDQICHWYALNDSFGPNGADGLWRNNPSAEDLSLIIGGDNDDVNDKGYEGIILHAIAETWTGAAGGKLDFLPLIENEDFLQNHLSFVGIEPVASGECVRKEDAEVAASVLHSCCEMIRDSSLVSESLFWCPDRELDQVMQQYNLYPAKKNRNQVLRAVAVRDGPRGSLIRSGSDKESFETTIPAVALKTEDGNPHDPTGAGNAYSGAMTALLGNGVDLTTSGCIASGVGAIVCEHEGLPPASEWNQIIDRIGAASREARSSMIPVGQ